MNEWELSLGDCLDPASGMASLCAPGSPAVDVVITDPPYAEHVHTKSRRGLSVSLRPGAKDEISERRELGFAHITSDQMFAAAAKLSAVARRWVLVFSDVESSHLWRDAFAAAANFADNGGLEYIRTCAWVKLGGAPQFTGDRPAVGFEAINCFHRPGRKRWNGGGKSGVYSFPTAIDRDRTGRDARVHTAQKPVALMEALVADFSDSNEMILDPFAGSGTTGFACIRLGRRFVGWELDPEYHELATRRLHSTRRRELIFGEQRDLFAVAEPQEHRGAGDQSARCADASAAESST